MSTCLATVLAVWLAVPGVLAGEVPGGAVDAAPAAAATAAADTMLRVGEVRLESHNIFSDREVAAARGLNRTLRRVMNALHVPTRPWVIRQELLLDEGDPLDPDRLAESERNLRALGILNRVAIVPADTAADGSVDLVVRSHETWTLSLGLNFSLAASGDLRWNLAATERNFLGWGTVVQAAVGDDLDASYGRLYLRQDRLFRSPATIELNYDDRSDGFSRWLALSVPFRSEDQTWSAAMRVMDRRYLGRWFLSNAGPAGADPDRDRSLYALLPRTLQSTRFEVLRRVSPTGRGPIRRLGLGLQTMALGHDLRDGLFVLSDGRVADLTFLGEPGQPLVRDRGTEVWPHLILSGQGRRWTQTRFLFSYGNLEDVPLDPAWELRVGPAGPAVGSTTGAGERWRLTLGAVNWDRTGDSFWLQRLAGYAYLGGAGDRNRYAELLLGNYHRFGPGDRPFTLKTFLEAGHGDGMRGDQAAFLGLERGLRTLDIDGMAGDRLLRWSTELGRTLPWVPLDIVHVGWGAFYSGGVAGWRDEDRGLRDARHEVGAGLRFGSTRSGRSDLARFDLTYDLSGRAGLVVTTISRGFF